MRTARATGSSNREMEETTEGGEGCGTCIKCIREVEFKRVDGAFIPLYAPQRKGALGK